jgi:hypothetical protein
MSHTVWLMSIAVTRNRVRVSIGHASANDKIIAPAPQTSRMRISSYRVENPERLPRKVVRLLFQTRRIEWDICDSESVAEARLEALICVLSPKFNAAVKVWPSNSNRKLVL